MTPATPRPWKSGLKTDSIEPDIAGCVDTILTMNKAHLNWKANRDLIVRAVNSHDALVAAVQAAREELGKRLLSEAICAKLDAALALATNGQEAG